MEELTKRMEKLESENLKLTNIITEIIGFVREITNQSKMSARILESNTNSINTLSNNVKILFEGTHDNSIDVDIIKEAYLSTKNILKALDTKLVDTTKEIDRLDKENNNVYEEIAKIKVSKKFHDLGLNSKVMILNRMGLIENLLSKGNNGNSMKGFITQIIVEDNEDSVKAEISKAIRKNNAKEEYLNNEAKEFLQNSGITY